MLPDPSLIQSEQHLAAAYYIIGPASVRPASKPLYTLIMMYTEVKRSMHL